MPFYHQRFVHRGAGNVVSELDSRMPLHFSRGETGISFCTPEETGIRFALENGRFWEHPGSREKTRSTYGWNQSE